MRPTGEKRVTQRIKGWVRRPRTRRRGRERGRDRHLETPRNRQAKGRSGGRDGGGVGDERREQTHREREGETKRNRTSPCW